MKKFYTPTQLKGTAKKLETATGVFECVLLSAAYQMVMTGQVGMVSHIKAVTGMRGYGAAGKKLLTELKVTDQMIKANKLGEKGKEHFAELRKAWADMGDESVIYEHLKTVAFAKVDKDKKEKTTQEKIVSYLAKVDVTGLTAEQALALRAFTATLVGEPAH